MNKAWTLVPALQDATIVLKDNFDLWKEITLKCFPVE